MLDLDLFINIAHYPTSPLHFRNLTTLDPIGTVHLVDSGLSGNIGLVAEPSNGGLLTLNVQEPGNVAFYRSDQI